MGLDMAFELSGQNYSLPIIGIRCEGNGISIVSK